MEFKTKFRVPENVSLSLVQRCPFKRESRFKEYVDVFPGPNFVSTEWRQGAKKVLSDSPGLVDFAIGLLNSDFPTEK